jgi:polyhydroxyalkanoate synthesis regulator phasin
MAETGPSRARRTSADAKSADDGSRRSTITRRAEAMGRNVGAIRDILMRSVLTPRNAFFLTRDRVEEVVEDAVRRGRMTRDDAQEIVQTLVQYGAKQTDDFLAELERLLARGANEESPSAGTSRRKEAARDTGKRSRKTSSTLPIEDYDDLSAAQVQERLDGLTPQELRKTREYERRHANRKTVLDPIERALR